MTTPIHGQSNSASALLGSNGAVVVSDTNEHQGPFYSISAITEVVIDEAELGQVVEGSINGITIPAGDSIVLYTIESVTLTSGTAILYKV